MGPGEHTAQPASPEPQDTRHGVWTGVGSLSLLQGIFLSQESNRTLLHSRWILYQLSYLNYLSPFPSLNLNALATIPSSYSPTIHAATLHGLRHFLHQPLNLPLSHPFLLVPQSGTHLSGALLSQMLSNSGWMATSHSSSPSHRKPAWLTFQQQEMGGGTVPPPQGWQDRISAPKSDSPHERWGERPRDSIVLNREAKTFQGTLTWF